MICHLQIKRCQQEEMRECGNQLIASSSEVACLDEDSDVVVVGVEASSKKTKMSLGLFVAPVVGLVPHAVLAKGRGRQPCG